jgi:hypothetical protein
MFTLTHAQSAQINSAEYTINYEAEAEHTDEEVLEARAEAVIKEETQYTAREDLGGLTVYLRDNTLVAFYDYEQFCGTVF